MATDKLLGARSDLYRRALELIPGGVNSPVRGMRAVGLDEPFFVASGDGAYLVDVDGNRYLDWVLSWGPLLFGHADPETIEAVRGAAVRGATFGAPTGAGGGPRAGDVGAGPSVGAGGPRPSPNRAGRGAGTVRRHARPHGARQDRRRRAPARRLRRTGGRDGAAGPERTGVPGRDALRQSARDGRRPVGAATATRPGRLRAARAEGCAARSGARRVRSRPSRRRDADRVHDRPRGAQLRGRAIVRYGALRCVVPASARRRRLSATVSIRSDVRLARTWRRRDRSNARACARFL